MTIEQYTYTAGGYVGVKEHEDGSVESLHGFSAMGEETKYIVLPDELGGGRVDIVHRMRHKCPMEDCGEEHDMIILAPTSDDPTDQLSVVECSKHGFLWCTL